MPVYSIEVQVAATAYIRAKNPAEAMEKAKALKDSSPDILDSGGDVPVSGARLDSSDLPEVSLSPAMTILGIWPGAEIEQADE